MPKLIRFNKPFNVLSQFTDESGKQTLSNFITVPNVYAAGRLDYDSEGLLLLTDYGPLNARITQPANKLPKTYYAQLDGSITDQAIAQLEKGVQLKDGLTLPAKAKIVDEPSWLWPRCPPIRQRNNDITSWLQLTIIEGKNRQVRRMTAAVGFPTLRLIRYSIGPWNIENLKPASSQEASIPEAYLKNTKSTEKNHNQRRPLRDLDTTRNCRHHHRRKR